MGVELGVIVAAVVSMTCWLILAADDMKLGSPVAI
jgi:hypothetical protein